MGYRDEGAFGPGGKKFVAVAASLLIFGVGGYFAVSALEDVDIEGLVDPPELETESGPAIDIEIPDFPEFNVPEVGADNPDPRTGKGFATILRSLEEKVGPEAPLVRVAVTLGGVDFHIRNGERAIGYTYSSLTGELQTVRVRVTGAGSLRDEDFPLSDISPRAIARITRGLEKATGDRGAELVSAVYDPILVFDERRWVITADADGRTGLVFEAEPDGGKVKPFGDGSEAPQTPNPPPVPQPAIPEEAQQAIDDAQEIFDCIEKAGGDVNKIQECVPGP